VAELFLALADERLPPFPATLVYELGRRGATRHRSYVLNFPGTKSGAAQWLAEGWHWPDDAREAGFREVIVSLRDTGRMEHFLALFAPGNWPQMSWALR